MSVIAQHRARLRDTTIARLRAYLAAHPPAAERVILFGSLARGDFDGASDADLLIIGGSLLDSAIFDAAGRDVDMICRTSAEWARAVASGNPFVREIEEHGVVLWSGQEDSNFHGVAPTSTSS